MRTLIQRVQHASVTIDGQLKSKIGKGLLVLVGIEDRDTQEDIEWLCKKIANLRIFDDENGVMNRSVVETEGEVMVVSQFTLHASTKKGNRPSYIHAIVIVVDARVREHADYIQRYDREDETYENYVKNIFCCHFLGEGFIHVSSLCL